MRPLAPLSCPAIAVGVASLAHSRPKDGVASLAYSRPKDGVASLAYSRPKDGVASLAYSRPKDGVASLAYVPAIDRPLRRLGAVVVLEHLALQSIARIARQISGGVGLRHV